jgi:hypothetical protein
MTQFLQVLAVLLVAVAMALTLAHALELPGKLRLPKEQYLEVQPIYYPGFTIGGIAEPAGLLALFVLLFYLPAGSTPFWLTVGAFVALAVMHTAYWLLTHPVNNFWLKDFQLKGLGARFFAVGTAEQAGDHTPADWTVLRDRWEYSHVLRAMLGFTSLALLATGVAE